MTWLRDCLRVVGAWLCAAVVTAAAAPLDVRLVDGLVGSPLGGQRVTIYEVDGAGTRTWRAAGTTDAAGHLRLDVPAPLPGGRHVARLNPFSQWLEHAVTVHDSTTIAAGRWRIRLLHGISGNALAGYEVRLSLRDADGKVRTVATLTSDAAGMLRLDPSLGAGTYLLRAVSPVDASLKQSAELPDAGEFTFAVGNPPVTYRLTDQVTGDPLADQRVEIRELLDDGSRRWVTSRSTDGDGRVRIDLDGLSDGRRYVFRAQPFLQPIEREVSAPGWLAVPAGRVSVQILNGDSGRPLPGAEVTLLRVESNGAQAWEFRAVADAEGRVRLDPRDLGHRDYLLRAASPVDGSLKFSAPIRGAGAVTFAVGNRALVFRLLRSDSGVPLAGLDVYANELLPDGTRGAGTRRTTDASGLVKFDLDGLGSGRRYVVRTKPFLQWIERSLDAPGWFDVPAGQVRVTVRSGATGSPLAGIPVRMYTLAADGGRTHVQTVTTDTSGRLVLDPAALGAHRYVLSAASPVDGTLKLSPPIERPGDVDFTVGSAGLMVRLTDWKSGLPLADQAVVIQSVDADGTRAWVANRTTGSDGRVRFDLPPPPSGSRYVARTKPFNQWIDRDVPTTGFVTVRAGTLRVTAVRGDTGAPLGGAPVKLLRILPDGNYEGVTTFDTSTTGELVLDPPELGSLHYVLRAASPVDGSLKYSTSVVAAGSFTFRVGGPALKATVRDVLTRRGLRDQRVQVWELRPDGSRTWVTQRTTGDTGQVVLDLDGLGHGRRYVIRTQPYASVVEREAGALGTLELPVGRALVALTDRDLHTPLEGREVHAYFKHADGSMKWTGKGVTDAAGRVRFDPEGLGGGKVVVFAVKDPFATGVATFFYSQPVLASGVVPFAVSRAGPDRLDRKPATLSVVMPGIDQRVDLGGFVLSGRVQEDVALREVRVTIRGASGVLAEVTAIVEPDSGRWTARVGRLAVAAGTRLTATVTAEDRAYNATTLAVPIRAIEDTVPPTLRVTTPVEGAHHDGLGLLVQGQVSDDTRWVELTGQVESGARVVAPFRLIEHDPVSGEWAMAIPRDVMRGLSSVQLRVRARDARGNSAESVRGIVIDPAGDALRHLVSRITFGASPELLADARLLGFRGFIERQLAPAAIDDSALDARLAAFPVDGITTLQRRTLLRIVASRRQLSEMMTWFWDNHFNTDYARHGWVAAEQAENDAFRAHALGRFRDLLGISARSPAMLRYLDNASSQKRLPNENYARELLEVHTLGTGYTHADIDEVARAFTGWTLVDRAFSFNPDKHDDGPKRVLGRDLAAGGGVLDGERVLDVLAEHPATARRLCRKLAQVFVADVPPSALVERCASTFLAARSQGDQVAQTLRVLLTSSEFLAAGVRGGKVKTGLEFLASAVRTTGALREGTDLPWHALGGGIDLFRQPVPTGYSHLSADWTNSFYAGRRLGLVRALIENAPGGRGLRADEQTLLAGVPAVRTAEGIAARMLQNVQAGAFDAAELATALDVLHEGGTRRFDAEAPDAGTRLRRLARTVLSMPRFQTR